MSKQKFPKFLFVSHGEDGDTTWFNANELVEVNELSKRIVSKPSK